MRSRQRKEKESKQEQKPEDKDSEKQAKQEKKSEDKDPAQVLPQGNGATVNGEASHNGPESPTLRSFFDFRYIFLWGAVALVWGFAIYAWVLRFRADRTSGRKGLQRHSSGKTRSQPRNSHDANCIVRLHGLDKATAHFSTAEGRNTPAILTGLTDNSAARSKWTPKFLRAVPHGMEIVNVKQRYSLAMTGGLQPNVDFKGKGKMLTLREYIDNELRKGSSKEDPPYVFDIGHYLATVGGKPLLQDLDVSPILDFDNANSGHWVQNQSARWVLALGGQVSGIPYHSHAAAWLELLAGRKAWWVAAPGTPVSVDVSERSSSLDNAHPAVCSFDQETGEIVYVPDGWMHAVQNDADYTLAVGQQARVTEPGTFTWLYSMILQAFQDGKGSPEHTRHYLEAALAKFPEEPSLHVTRTKIAIGMPQIKIDALEAAEKAFHYNPKSLEAQLLRVVALDRAGKKHLKQLKSASQSLYHLLLPKRKSGEFDGSKEAHGFLGPLVQIMKKHGITPSEPGTPGQREQVIEKKESQVSESTSEQSSRSIDPRFRPPPVSDVPIYDLWSQHEVRPVVAVAQDLGVIDRFSKGPMSISTVRKTFKFSLRAAEAMVAVLAGSGMLSRQPDGKFAITEVAQTYLVTDAVFSVGHVAHTTLDGQVKMVRKAFEPGAPEWEPAYPSIANIYEQRIESVREIISHMHAMLRAASVYLASSSPEFTGVKNLLDVGGGSGALSAALLAYHPRMKVTLMDLPNVCQVAIEHLQKMGTSPERLEILPGDMFKDKWSEGHDAVIFSNIWHDWDPQRNKKLAASAFAALLPGGKIFLHEMLMNEGKDGPLIVACYSVKMLLYESGKQYTASELREILEGVGFVDVKVRPAHGYYSLVVATKPS